MASPHNTANEEGESSLQGASLHHDPSSLRSPTGRRNAFQWPRLLKGSFAVEESSLQDSEGQEQEPFSIGALVAPNCRRNAGQWTRLLDKVVAVNEERGSNLRTSYVSNFETMKCHEILRWGFSTSRDVLSLNKYSCVRLSTKESKRKLTQDINV